MPDQLQLRGGTTTEHNSFTGAAREVTVDTTKKTLVVHDGSQAGGTPLMKESGATAASSVQIGTGGVERFKITSSEVVFNETSTDTDFRVEGNGDANLLFVNAGTDRVGIGTNAPTSPLEVSSAANPVVKATSTSSSVGAGFIAQGGSSNDSQFQLNSETTAKYTFLRDGSQADDLRIYDSANALDIIRYRHGGYLHFGVNGSERMRISSSGNLGIGTTNPLSKLSIVETASVNSAHIKMGTSTNQNTHLELENDGSADIRFGCFGSSATAFGNITANNAFIHATNDLSINAGTPSGTGNIKIGTGATPSTKMIITTAGNVGINSDSSGPDRLLHVSDVNAGGVVTPFRLTNVAGTSGTEVRMEFECGLDEIAWIGAKHEGSDIGPLTFATASSQGAYPTEKMRITSAGKVGIGVTSPIGRLHLYEASNDPYIYIQRGSGDTAATLGGIFWRNSTNSLALIDAQSTDINDGLMRFYTMGSGTLSERMRITSAGRVGIGTTNPTAGLEVATSDAVVAEFTASGSSGGYVGLFTGANGAAQGYIGRSGQLAGVGGTAGNLSIRSESELEFVITSSGASTVRAKITPSGIETTNTMKVSTAANLVNPITIDDSINNNFSTNAINFQKNSTGSVGSITCTRSATSYNTSSDYRLKENAVKISDGITRLKTLIPRRFNWISDDTNTLVDGFFAHEVTAVPEAITGTKDQVATEDIDGKNIKKGDPIYQQIDQAKLVPLLVAAVQELIGKVEVLEAA